MERAEQTENEKPTNGGKVDKRQKKVNLPSIPNGLVSTLLGQTIVLCRFKLDFALCKSASIDVSDSEFRRRYGGVGVVLRYPIRVLPVDAQLTDPTGEPAQAGPPKDSPEAGERARHCCPAGKHTRRAVPDRTGDGAQEVAASQVQKSVTDLVFLGAESLQIAPRYLVHGVCREANPVSSEHRAKG